MAKAVYSEEYFRGQVGEFALKILIERQKVERRIAELAVEVAADYAESAPLFIGILNGAAQFMMALIDRLPDDILARLDYDFVDVASYQGKESTGQVELLKDLVIAVEGRHVLLIDGIVDTGRSLDFVLNMIHARKPLSLKTCALLDKSARRALPVPVDYCGFAIEDAFVVGYGMDYDQRHRALHHIAIIDKIEETDNR